MNRADKLQTISIMTSHILWDDLKEFDQAVKKVLNSHGLARISYQVPGDVDIDVGRVVRNIRDARQASYYLQNYASPKAKALRGERIRVEPGTSPWVDVICRDSSLRWYQADPNKVWQRLYHVIQAKDPETSKHAESYLKHPERLGLFSVAGFILRKFKA